MLRPYVVSMPALPLHDYLNGLVDRYERPTFIDDDPIAIPHGFDDARDREVIGLYAALLAWGRRATIMAKLAELCERMRMRPYAFVRDFDPERDGPRLDGFKHRTFQPSDAFHLTRALSALLREHGSLEPVFARHLPPDAPHVGPAIQGFSESVMSAVPDVPAAAAEAPRPAFDRQRVQAPRDVPPLDGPTRPRRFRRVVGHLPRPTRPPARRAHGAAGAGARPPHAEAGRLARRARAHRTLPRLRRLPTRAATTSLSSDRAPTATNIRQHSWSESYPRLRDEPQQIVAVALQLGRADTFDGEKRVVAVGPGAGDGVERAVVEDDVRRDALRLRLLGPPRFERAEEVHADLVERAGLHRRLDAGAGGRAAPGHRHLERDGLAVSERAPSRRRQLDDGILGPDDLEVARRDELFVQPVDIVLRHEAEAAVVRRLRVLAAVHPLRIGTREQLHERLPPDAPLQALRRVEQAECDA